MQQGARGTTENWVDPVALRAEVLGMIEDRRARHGLEVREFERLARIGTRYSAPSPLRELPPELREQFLVIGGEGTPAVSEFVFAELSAALCVPELRIRIDRAAALDLIHRLPQTWQLCRAGRVQLWAVRRMAELTRPLSASQADWVDQRLSRLLVGRLPLARQLRLVEGLVVEVDPDAATERERAARARRHVRVRSDGQGSAWLDGQLDLLDAQRFDASLDRYAEILSREPGEQRPKSVLRAKAIGIASNPALPLAMLQYAAQPELLAEYYQQMSERLPSLARTPGDDPGIGAEVTEHAARTAAGVAPDDADASVELVWREQGTASEDVRQAEATTAVGGEPLDRPAPPMLHPAPPMLHPRTTGARSRTTDRSPGLAGRAR